MKKLEFNKKIFLRHFLIISILSPTFYFLGKAIFQSPLEHYENTRLEFPLAPQPQNATLVHGIDAKEDLELTSEEIKRCLQTDFIYQKIQSDKEFSLAMFFKSGRKHKVPPWEMEHAAMLAGVSIPEFRKAVRNDTAHQTSLYRQSNKQAKLNRLQVDELLTKNTGEKPAHVEIFSTEMDGQKLADERWVIEKLQLGSFTEVAKQIQKNQNVPLLLSQFDPITAAILLNSDITFDDLLPLHEAGVPFTLASLAQLSTLEQGADIAEQILAMTPDIAIKERWKAGFYVVNLLTFALQNDNIALAQFWYDRGVSPRPIVHGINALDAFPAPENTDKPFHEAQQLLTQLLSEEIQPYQPQAEQKIKRWFENEPDALKDRDLAVQWQHTNITKREEAVSSLKNFFARIEQRSIDKASMTPKEFEQCKKNDIFISARERSIAGSNTSHEFTLLSPEKQLKRLAGLEIHPLAAPFLEPFGSQILNVLWTPKKQKADVETTPEMEELMRKQRIAAAIRSFESVDDIIGLLEEGYPMDDETIHVIAQNGRIELIDPLLNYGLNLEGKNAKGQNALYAALTGFKPFETFNYLFEQKNLPIVKGSQLLLHAVQLNAYDRNTPKIVKKLMQNGVKPGRSHWTALVYHVPTGSPVYRHISKLFEQQGKIVFN